MKIMKLYQFTDGAIFITKSSLNLVNNLAKGIHKLKCKYGHDDIKCKTCIIKHKGCEFFLECTNVKDDFVA